MPAKDEIENELATVILEMGMATDKGKYARYLARKILGVPDVFDRPDQVAVITNGTLRLIPRDEPVFLLRAQDTFAGDALLAWIYRANREIKDGDKIIDSAKIQLQKFREWPIKKIPDLPKHTPAIHTDY